MAWNLDARIPLLLVADPTALAQALAEGSPAAVLRAGPGALPAGAVAQAEFAATAATHAAACACCAGRGAAATALDRLFQARIRNQCPWFTRVLALVETPEAAAEVTAALTQDALTLARFRPG